MMKIKITVTIVFLFCILKAPAQVTATSASAKPSFKERIFISPDIGLQFGTVTVINISPKVGYRITDRWAAGIGGTYIYYKDKRYKSLGYTFETSIYGGSVFTQYQVFEPVRLYAEYEILDIETFDTNTFETRRRLVPGLLVGGGYTQAIGGNSSFTIMLLYNLLDGPYSIYENPILRIGFNFGL